jgi:hypothetical protein
MRERLEDLALLVLPSMQNLPLVLKDLQQDDHPMAVEVYIRLSRGAFCDTPVGVSQNVLLAKRYCRTL